MSGAALLEICSRYDSWEPGTAHPRIDDGLRDAAIRDLNSLITVLRYERPSTIRRYIQEAGIGPQQKPESSCLPESFVQVTGYPRGCKWGMCCVFSMWFDSRYRCVRGCQHKCRLSHGRFAHCGPSLLEDSGRARGFAEFKGGNQSLLDACGGGQNIQLLSKRRKPAKRGTRQEVHKNPETPEAAPAPCNHNRVPLVAHPYPKSKRVRNPKRSTPVSRIGKCMGSLSFGKLRKERTKEIPLASAGVEISVPSSRIRGARGNHGRRANQESKKQGKTNGNAETFNLPC